MAKFRYRMQNVLDIKMRLETQARTEFAESSARVAEEEEKMRQLIYRKQDYEQQLKDLSSGTIDIPAIRRCKDSIRSMDELMQQQAVNLRVAQRALDRVRQKLNEAIQERKIHEKLKEKAFEEFKLELNAEEMKEIDQLVSFKYNDNGKEEDDG